MISDLASHPCLVAAQALHPAYYIAPIGAVLALIMAVFFSKKVMQESEGDKNMIEIADAVRQGAMAYLTRQYKVVFFVFIALVIVLGIISVGLGLQPKMSMVGVPIAGLFSGLCGWFGMKMATNASARTTHAAKQSLNAGLVVAFRSGAVMGLVVVGFALLDVSAWFFIFNMFTEFSLPILTTIMLSYGMGASTQALFARVGGGIYTKAADVGADLVGKVEAGIPEDDPRNPATIADNVGDNVGDVAGMGADLYESYYGSILATMALGAAAATGVVRMAGDTSETVFTMGMKLVVGPLALAGIGILLSLVGIFSVKAKEDAGFAELLKGLHKGVYIASGLIVLVGLGLLWWIFHGTPVNPFGIWGSIVAGLSAGLVIAHATEYYTSYEFAPTKRISEAAITGPATVIIGGIAEGMKSTWASLLTIIVAIIAAFSFAGGGDNFLMGLYGVGIAAVGMLSTLGITLATDAYGPIADNAGGNAEMTGQPPEVRQRTDMLDALGNTTAATGKGFAIGSAALTALALFAAYVQIVQVQLVSQAEQYIEKNPVHVNEATAFYTGYGKFAIVLPGDEDGTYVDAGMWMNADKVPAAAREGIEKGDEITIHPTEDAAGEERQIDAWSAVVPYGDGKTATLHISASRNASLRDVLTFYNVTLMNPLVLGGMFSGVLLAFLFCALTMDAVGRAANKMMVEARRQFGKMREGFRKQGLSEEDIANPQKWPHSVELDGHKYPDYANCVAISTTAAQKEMIIPACLAIIVPIAVGLVLGVPGVMGLLAGGLTSGFALAIYMANAGGAWDNAKKLIESLGTTTAQDLVDSTGNFKTVPEGIKTDLLLRAEELIADGQGDTIIYGKGSDNHKATVVGDTVGDPFKDTSGPSLNILIKLISIVSVVFAGLIVKFGAIISDLIGLS
ncbi:MAG: sodium-translocating pyrophosphatase [Phycisphaerales bacterium]|nr:sodium-translocating pyrophosphatase [Phycisphaerales bacterium]